MINMKNINEFILESTKIKMSKLFTSNEKLKNNIVDNFRNSKSSLPQKLSENAWNNLNDKIYSEYKVFPNGYIFSDEGKLYLAYVSTESKDSGKVKDSSNKYTISIYLDIDYKIYKVRFEGYNNYVTGSKINDSIIKDFKNGISLNDLIKKYDYYCSDKQCEKYLNELK